MGTGTKIDVLAMTHEEHIDKNAPSVTLIRSVRTHKLIKGGECMDNVIGNDENE